MFSCLLKKQSHDDMATTAEGKGSLSKNGSQSGVAAAEALSLYLIRTQPNKTRSSIGFTITMMMDSGAADKDSATQGV